MAYSFKCFNCGKISTSGNSNNYYDYSELIYKCNNLNCDRQFWMTIGYPTSNSEFVNWKEKIIYHYKEFCRIEIILYKPRANLVIPNMYYEFLNLYNDEDDSHNIILIEEYQISKTEDMINFIIKYIDNLIFR